MFGLGIEAPIRLSTGDPSPFPRLFVPYVCVFSLYPISSCSLVPFCHAGVLTQGWYCPPGTIHPFSFACGGPEYYCPEGSGRRLPVDTGFYAGGIEVERGGAGGGGYSFQVGSDGSIVSSVSRTFFFGKNKNTIVGERGTEASFPELRGLGPQVTAVVYQVSGLSLVRVRLEFYRSPW